MCCPCCPWERVLDPLFLILCCPCLCVSHLCLKKKKEPDADESAAAKKKTEEEAKEAAERPPPVNEIDRMNRAMYETPAGENEPIAKATKAAA